MGLSCTDLRGYEKLISLWGGGEEVTCHNTGFRAKGMERVSEQKASTSLIQCNLLGSTRNLRYSTRNIPHEILKEITGVLKCCELICVTFI